VSGPIVAGWVADSWSYGAAFWVTTGILAGAGALAARSPDIRPAVSSSADQSADQLVTAEIQADLTAEKA
jgi:hypothetical protein